MTATLRRRPTPAPRQPTLPGDVRWTLGLARGLSGLGLLLLAATAAAWVVQRPQFELREIEVRGDVQRITVAALRQAVLPRLSGSFFTVDLAQAAAAFEAVPWVRQAVVQRVWPNRLRVTLQEHEPAALWNTEDGMRLVNTRGEVFEANVGAVEDDLPTLQGPDGTAARVLTLYRALQALWAPKDVEVAELVLSSRGSWSLKLDTGARIELGRGDDTQVVERTALFLQTLPQITSRFAGALQHADLRHRDGYALRLAGVTTDPNPNKAPTRAAARPPAPRPADPNR
jgi:cell division protein FtsQ